MDLTRWDSVTALLFEDRIERYKTGTIDSIKVIVPQGEPDAMSAVGSYNAYMEL